MKMGLPNKIFSIFVIIAFALGILLFLVVIYYSGGYLNLDSIEDINLRFFLLGTFGAIVYTFSSWIIIFANEIIKAIKMFGNK
jgi:hypothetical protein